MSRPLLDWATASTWVLAPPKLAAIANAITAELAAPVADDTIVLCGGSALSLLANRPEDVLRFAQEKLHTWHYSAVPTQWRRLYEEACLHMAAKDLSSVFLPDATATATTTDTTSYNEECERRFADAIKHLDRATFIAGAPGRRALIESTFDELETFLANAGEDLPTMPLNIERPGPLHTDHPIWRCARRLSFQEFDAHLFNNGSPIIIPQVVDDWQANKLWYDASYLLRRTLGGRRIVPVEIGNSYTDSTWKQELMPFFDFITKFMATDKPEAVGYLAQHDLLSQIPKLRNDIMMVDYTWTQPPPPQGAAAETFGLANTPQLHQPQLNAWLGPKGTKTPLHTDAYHNILCQVVGHKYVRLYPPEERVKLYPMTVDENGIEMGNTSSVDVKYITSKGSESKMDAKTAQELNEKFPLSKDANYQEAYLGAGDCLYIPLGWWHYVESKSNSFSVSIWWN